MEHEAGSTPHAPDAPPTGLSRADELRRGWRPLVACSVGIGLGLSPIPPYAAGIFATALQKEFGWPRGEILAAIMFITVALVLLGAPVGRLTDRIGARKVAIGSTIGLSASLAMMAAIDGEIWTLYACWACLAVVALGTFPLTYAKIISGWFDRARGLALGLALASTGISGAIFPFYLGWLIDAFGWRVAFLGLAALPLFVALPILLLWLRDPPRPAAIEVAPQADGLTVREALGQYRFWASALAGMALAGGTAGLIPNLMPLLLESGLSAGSAAKALAALAFAVTAGRLVAGYLLDRLWAPLVGLLLAIPAIVAVVLLGIPGSGLALVIVAVGAIGLIAGAEFDLVAYMTGRYFGQRHFGQIYGVQYAVFGLGAGVAPAAYGAIHDRVGSYQPSLVVSGVLFVVGALLLLTLGRYPARFSAPRHG